MRGEKKSKVGNGVNVNLKFLPFVSLASVSKVEDGRGQSVFCSHNAIACKAGRWMQRGEHSLRREKHLVI